MNLLKLSRTNLSKPAAFKHAIHLLLNTKHVSVGEFNKSDFREEKNAICGKKKTTHFKSQFVPQLHRIHINFSTI